MEGGEEEMLAVGGGVESTGGEVVVVGPDLGGPGAGVPVEEDAVDTGGFAGVDRDGFCGDGGEFSVREIVGVGFLAGGGLGMAVSGDFVGAWVGVDRLA